jgi:hypothetical protein
MNQYNSKWINTIKNHDKLIAILSNEIDMVDNLTNSLNAHEITSINDDPFLFKTMNKINNIVDKNEHGVVEQGVYIGGPTMTGGTRIRKNPLIGTDSATYLPSTNATESLVDAISMGGSKIENKELEKARKSMSNYLSGVKKTKPMNKHLMLLQDAGELEGGNIFKDISKTASKTAKSISKESKKVVKKVDKYATPIMKKGATLGFDIIEKAAPALGGIAGAAAATALGQPELIPVFGAIGSATGDQLAKRGRKEVKKQTGLGKPRISPWIEHVKRYANDNKITYKEAMSKAKSSYKK